MIKLLFCLMSFVFAGPPLTWGPNDTALFFTSGLQFKGTSAINIYAGTADPSITPTLASKGSLYLSSNGNLYIKQDAGLTSNWIFPPPGVLGVANGGTGSSSYTAGSVVFAGAGGTTLTQNNSKFYWDNTNYRLGLRMNSPQGAIHYGALGAANTTSGTVNADAMIFGVINSSADVGAGSVIFNGQNGANSVSGADSAAFGFSNNLQSLGTFAAGYSNTVSTGANYSVVFGQGNLVGTGALYSVAFGNNSTASGVSSMAFGTGAQANGYQQIAAGEFNTTQGTGTSRVSTDQVFIIGNGSTTINRSTAFAVTRDAIARIYGTTSGSIGQKATAATTDYNITWPGSQGAANTTIINDGSGGLSWSKADLTTNVTGILPVANGGTGSATLTARGVLIGNGASAIHSSLVGSSGTIFMAQGTGADPIWTTATYPGSTTINQILYSSSANTVAGITAGGSGTILMSDNGLPSYTSATYPRTTTANQVLYSSSTNTVAGITSGSAAVMITNTSSVPSFLQGTISNRLLRFDGTSLSFAQVNLATDVTGSITVPTGGTGSATLTAHGILIGNATSAIHDTGAGTSGQILISQGASADPTWLTTLPIANGGTNNTALGVTAGGLLYTDGSKLVNAGAGSSGQLLVSQGTAAPIYRSAVPIITRYTSGNNTWTPAAGTQWIKVTVIGGGGGGGASGTAAGGTATSGGSSTFGGMITAGQGRFGATRNSGAPSGAGGTASTSGSATVVYSFAGGYGGGSNTNVAGGGFAGGLGGNSGCSSGNGNGGSGEGSQGAAANSGAGGGGGGTGSTAASTSGGGGGGGACVVAIFTSLGVNASANVGAGGTGATAGTNGFVGGDGGTGAITIEEYPF